MALGEKDRIVTTLYFYEGLTRREIGAAMNVTGEPISQILHRALAKLRVTFPRARRPTGCRRATLPTLIEAARTPLC